jgi:hypothetical protein
VFDSSLIEENTSFALIRNSFATLKFADVKYTIFHSVKLLKIMRRCSDELKAAGKMSVSSQMFLWEIS